MCIRDRFPFGLDKTGCGHEKNEQQEDAVDHRRHVQLQASGVFTAAAGKSHDGCLVVNLTFVISSLCSILMISLTVPDFACRSTRTTTLTRSLFPFFSSIVSFTSTATWGSV